MIYSNIMLKSVQYLKFFASLPHILQDSLRRKHYCTFRRKSSCTITNNM